MLNISSSYLRIAAYLSLTLLYVPLSAQNCGYLSPPNTTEWPPAEGASCTGTLIRTDPYNPYNLENRQRANTFNWIDPNPEAFSWWEEYCLNSSTISATTLKTPFSQDNNSVITHFLTSQDKYPKDGWELIKYGFGYTATGQATGSMVDYPFVVLYNRFTGILRVFVALSEINVPYDVAEISLKFLSGPMSSNLDLSTAFTATQNGITSLKDFVSVPRFHTGSRFISGPGRWLYAEFPTLYDPCVCSYDSKLKIEVNLISHAEIIMSSTSTGTLVPDEDALSKSNNTYEDRDGQHSWGWENIAGFNQKALQKSLKGFKDMQGFRKSIGKAIDKSGIKSAEKQDKKSEVGELISELELPNAFKEGLKALPYVSSAISFLDFFVGGGKEASGPQSVIVQPMAMEFNSRYKGTVTATNRKKEITFSTPGGTNISPNNPDYPYYNEPMGVFHLVETPQIYTKTPIIAHIAEVNQYAFQDVFVDPYGHQPFIATTGSSIFFPDHVQVAYKRYRFNMPAAPEYLVNPAAEFTPNSEVMGAFFVVAQNAENMAVGVGHLIGEDFNLLSEGKGLYHTPYLPLSCMDEMTLDFATDAYAKVEIYLSVIANFERGDSYVTPSTQNVLWAGKFAVNMNHDPALDETSPFRGIPLQTTLDQPQVFLSDAASWGTLSIQSGAVLSASSPITIRAAEGFEIEPGATISPNITLEIAAPNGCFPILYQPTDPSTLATYCLSSSYNSSERQTRTSNPSADVSEIPTAPLPLTLFPNPTSGTATLRYELPEKAAVSIEVRDLMGRLLISATQSQPQAAGQHEQLLEVGHLAAGVYLVVFQTGKQQQTVRLVKE